MSQSDYRPYIALRLEDGSIEETGPEHYAWLDYTAHLGCVHEAVRANGRLELIYCQRCHHGLVPGIPARRVEAAA